MSNLVLGGSMTVAEITLPYGDLVKRYGVHLVRDTGHRPLMPRSAWFGWPARVHPCLTTVSSCRRGWTSSRGNPARNGQARRVRQGAARLERPARQTVALRKQLEAMPDGGCMHCPFLWHLTVPHVVRRRACQVAHYFSKEKPKSKVLNSGCQR